MPATTTTPRSAHRGFAASEIDTDGELDYVEKHGVDVIVMATDGRSGRRRRMIGSVAERVVHESSQPVLLVRVRGDGKRGADQRRMS